MGGMQSTLVLTPSAWANSQGKPRLGTQEHNYYHNINFDPL